MFTPLETGEGPAGIAIEWFGRVGSTQDVARERMQAGPWRRLAVIADAQDAGRGQRGRRWQSPPGAALYLTLAWPMQRPLAGLAGLSLAIGLSLRTTLARYALDARLKWPNDVLLAGRKLAGILVELQQGAGETLVLVGVGMNRQLPAEAVAAIDQPVIDLASVLNSPPTLAGLADAVLQDLAQVLTRFDAEGFAAFAADWGGADALAGHPVRIELEGRELAVGHALGVDAMGRLLIRSTEGIQPVSAGTASVRLDSRGTS